MIRIVFGFVALCAMAVPAVSHDWFNDRVDPVSGARCCGGTDCAPVPKAFFDSGAVVETKDGYWVNLTIEQSQRFNKANNMPIRDFVPWSRVQMSSDDGHGVRDKAKSGFAMCIWRFRVQCFFRPPGNA